MIAKWDVFEVVFEGPSNNNPFVDVTLGATFSLARQKCRRCRAFTMATESIASASWQTKKATGPTGRESNTAALSGHHGSLRCHASAPRRSRPGRRAQPVSFRSRGRDAVFPVRHYLLRLDASAPRHAGARHSRLLPLHASTRFGWAFSPSTTFTMRTSRSFPHLRRGVDGREDFDRFNVAMFRHFEKQVGALRELGIEADVILFHPYDRWGYCSMSEDQDIRYLRYVVARLAAYSNVWWSLANEYDFLLDVKPMARWDRYFQIIEECDPWQPPEVYPQWRRLDELRSSQAVGQSRLHSELGRQAQQLNGASNGASPSSTTNSNMKATSRAPGEISPPMNSCTVSG